jgi:TRAP-type C4-dicarboxylate transport system substrate-binding protein
MTTKTINWVLAHEPYHVFIEAARSFADEVADETNGEYQIDVVDLNEWNAIAQANLSVHTTDREKIIGLVDSGVIDMATVYASTLGRIDRDMYALTMPFLFDSDEHARGVIDGAVGQHMLAKVADNSGIRGLAFTYSGGFRIVPSNRQIESINDFYNMNIGCGNNPVAVETFKAVGSNPVPMYIEDLEASLESGRVDGGETTYTRFFVLGHDRQTSHINDNEHSLFLTSLIINQQLWLSLGERTQGIFARAAMRAAQIERDHSLADNVLIQKRAAEQGIPTVRMTENEKARFVTATKGLYNNFNTYFSPGLLDQLTNGKLN